ncbi:alpha amylase [Flammeovirgaceae bacterium 311]|nr:alpha amylase [Flammeovirgaceae bacterium 311]
MRKILYTIIPLLFFGIVAHSQTVTISPRNFTAVDEITITVDVTGNTALENLTTDAYLWLWVPGGPGAPSNVSPAASNANATAQAKFTKVEGEENLYTITLVPATFIGASPAEITQLGVILKGNDWSNGQTADALFDVDPLEFVDRVNRTFPDDFVPEDVVTIFFNQALADAGPIQDIEQIYATITATGVDESGTEVADIPLKNQYAEALQMKHEVAQIYSTSILPAVYFEVPAGVRLTAISYSFHNQDGSITTPTFTDEFLTQE